MKRRIRLFVIFTLLALGCVERAQAQFGPAPVEVSKTHVRTIDREISLVGTVVADRRSVVASEVAGPVVQVQVREGDHVKRGAVLARLRRRSFELLVKEQEARLKAARSRLVQAQDDLERKRGLERKQIIAEGALIEARERALALESEMLSLEASLEVARDRLVHSVIRAPFDGVVLDVHTEIGEWLAEADAVATLIDLSRCELRLPLPERYVTRVEAGDQVVVTVPFARAEPYPGEVRSVLPEADPQARTFPLLIDIENDGRLRAGMSVKATVVLGGSASTVVVDQDALVETPMGTVVFVVRDGKVKTQVVTTGQPHQGEVPVGESLKAGETVVVRGNERLMDGQDVKVVNQP